LVQRIA